MRTFLLLLVAASVGGQDLRTFSVSVNDSLVGTASRINLVAGAGIVVTTSPRPSGVIDVQLDVTTARFPRRYLVPLSGTSILVPAATHGMGPFPAVAVCYDSVGRSFHPGGLVVSRTGDLIIQSAVAMTGTCVVE